jgi:hypothetical protein
MATTRRVETRRYNNNQGTQVKSAGDGSEKGRIRRRALRLAARVDCVRGSRPRPVRVSAKLVGRDAVIPADYVMSLEVYIGTSVILVPNDLHDRAAWQ